MMASNANAEHWTGTSIVRGTVVCALATSFPDAADRSHRPYGDPVMFPLAFDAQVPR